jgi:hypothetical protein
LRGPNPTRLDLGGRSLQSLLLVNSLVKPGRSNNFKRPKKLAQVVARFGSCIYAVENSHQTSKKKHKNTSSLTLSSKSLG